MLKEITLRVRGICNSLVVLGSGTAFFLIDLKVVIDTPRVCLSPRVCMNFGKVAMEGRFWFVFIRVELTAIREARVHGLGAHVAAINVGITGRITFVLTRPIGRLVERCDYLGFHRLRRITGRLGTIIIGRNGRMTAS